MAITHYEVYRGEKFAVRGFDTPTLLGLISLVSIAVQLFLGYFAFYNAAGFLFALTIISNPLVFGTFSIILSKQPQGVLKRALIIGVSATVLSIFFYFSILLPQVSRINMVYFLLPAIAYSLVLIGLAIRFNRKGPTNIYELVSLGMGLTLLYVVYLSVWVDVFAHTLFGA